MGKEETLGTLCRACEMVVLFRNIAKVNKCPPRGPLVFPFCLSPENSRAHIELTFFRRSWLSKEVCYVLLNTNSEEPVFDGNWKRDCERIPRKM